MEEDIKNYSPTVMFRGTPCMSDTCSFSGGDIYPTATIGK